MPLLPYYDFEDLVLPPYTITSAEPVPAISITQDFAFTGVSCCRITSGLNDDWNYIYLGSINFKSGNITFNFKYHAAYVITAACYFVIDGVYTSLIGDTGWSSKSIAVTAGVHEVFILVKKDMDYVTETITYIDNLTFPVNEGSGAVCSGTASVNTVRIILGAVSSGTSVVKFKRTVKGLGGGITGGKAVKGMGKKVITYGGGTVEGACRYRMIGLNLLVFIEISKTFTILPVTKTFVLNEVV